MRLMLCLLALGLFAYATTDAQRAGVPVVKVDRPTVVALFPDGSKIGPHAANGNEALSDFKYYAMRAKKPLTRLGVQFIEEDGRSFRIRSGDDSALFTRNTDTPIYYFFAQGKRPRIEIGVRTDSDLLDLARQYFAEERK